MATITVTENLIASLNKFSTERDSKYLDRAVKYTIDLFAKQVSRQANNNLNDENLKDFADLVALYRYTNASEIANSVTDYFNSSIKNSLIVQHVSEQEVSKKVA